MNTYHRWLAPALAGGCGIASCAALFAFFDYPLFANWGALSDERDARLPGDELIPGGLQSTRAITVDAPPNDVWPWLVQMGQDRGGFYSHDWLERFFGADIHNADDINPDWQQLAVGDTIWPYPERKLRTMAKRSSHVGGWNVAALEAARWLVVQSNAGRWTWALVLQPLPNRGTRLLARTRFSEPENFIGRVMDALVGQPAHLVMETGVLHGVKARVERKLRTTHAEPVRAAT